MNGGSRSVVRGGGCGKAVRPSHALGPGSGCNHAGLPRSGFTIQPGREHPGVGTRNATWRIASYIELITVHDEGSHEPTSAGRGPRSRPPCAPVVGWPSRSWSPTSRRPWRSFGHEVSASRTRKPAPSSNPTAPPLPGRLPSSPKVLPGRPSLSTTASRQTSGAHASGAGIPDQSVVPGPRGPRGVRPCRKCTLAGGRPRTPRRAGRPGRGWGATARMQDRLRARPRQPDYAGRAGRR
jgi:hypothetical protein